MYVQELERDGGGRGLSKTGESSMETDQSDSGRWSPKPVDSSQMMEAREVEHLLRTLHQSWEHDELQRALLRVLELFPLCESMPCPAGSHIVCMCVHTCLWACMCVCVCVCVCASPPYSTASHTAPCRGCRSCIPCVSLMPM